MLTTQEQTINGRTFAVSQLPARKALHTLHRLGKALGPAFAQAVGALGPAGANTKIEAIELSKLGGALQALFVGLSEADLDYFTNTLLESATVDGAPLLRQLDVVFQGQIDGLIKLLIFAVEVNYASFFKGLGDIARLGPRTA